MCRFIVAETVQMIKPHIILKNVIDFIGKWEVSLKRDMTLRHKTVSIRVLHEHCVNTNKRKGRNALKAHVQWICNLKFLDVLLINDLFLTMYDFESINNKKKLPNQSTLLTALQLS